MVNPDNDRMRDRRGRGVVDAVNAKCFRYVCSVACCTPPSVCRWNLKILSTRVLVMRVACTTNTTEETPASWQAMGVDVLRHANHITIVYCASRLSL